MAINATTPGVYIEEVSRIPASVVPVATAIPGFIGYTEKGPTNVPTRISSMLEYEATFGGPFDEPYTILLTGASPTTNYTITDPTFAKFALHYNMQMYFANGGGPCWIISIGSYSSTFATVGNFTAGLAAAEQVDEITLIVAPEVVSLADASRKTFNDAALLQCSLLKDRFVLMDVEDAGAASVKTDGDNFRSLHVGANNLKYGAAYFPALNTPIVRSYDETKLVVTDSRTGFSYTYGTSPNNTLSTIRTGVVAYVEATVGTLTTSDNITINGVVLIAGAHFAIGATPTASAANLRDAINAHPVLSQSVRATSSAATITVLSVISGTAGNITATVTANFTITDGPDPGVNNTADSGLYAKIKADLDKKLIQVYPSAAMAGVYASVDRDRGVWKAPANVGVNLVDTLSTNVSADEQGLLNVDPTSGKSINAIRSFAGRGILVWGARTLAGNDNEWRYINVRRLFIFVEESIKKATEFVVFEPNDSNTWARLKTMIGSFLTDLWRSGGLVGAKTEHAFFIKVGLGETMTAQDILEGKCIIQIGMAASRPAEFIILQFEHKLQES